MLPDDVPVLVPAVVVMFAALMMLPPVAVRLTAPPAVTMGQHVAGGASPGSVRVWACDLGLTRGSY